MALPCTIRHENAGRVHAAGPAVTNVGVGDKVIVHRCVIGAGGPGHIGVQVLKALTAAEAIVVDRNPDAVEPATSIGADHGVVADGSHISSVLDLTHGHGIETTIDFAGEGGVTRDGVALARRAGDHHVVRRSARWTGFRTPSATWTPAGCGAARSSRPDESGRSPVSDRPDVRGSRPVT
ncbi:zinc-binding dehydrogenase, partial [Lentzea sp. NPDC060358]|uniref:zinc-binding dehydrogenase n=1 Tax=Lentzea sp. NPDC060358 TaxID=3347103 RepID=UPI00365436A2